MTFRSLHSLIIVSSVILLLVPSASAADVALLVSSDIPAYSKAALEIERALPSHTRIHTYRMNGDLEQGHEMGKTIRVLNPDLVFVIGLKAALVAKAEILDQPVVFCLVTQPSRYGLPAPNMTGVFMDPAIADQLQSVHTVLPGVHHVGALYSPHTSREHMLQVEKAAARFHLILHAKTVSTHKDIPSALRHLVGHVDALWLPRDETVVNQESLAFIMATAIDAQVPVFGFSPGLMRFGALGAFSGDYRAMGRQAGELGHTILVQRLRGGSLPPPVPPSVSQLSLNLNAARVLNLTIPDRVLRMAGQLYGGPGALAFGVTGEGDPFSLDGFLLE